MIFTEDNSLGWQLWSFRTWNKSFQVFLPLKVSILWAHHYKRFDFSVLEFSIPFFSLKMLIYLCFVGRNVFTCIFMCHMHVRCLFYMPVLCYCTVWFLGKNWKWVWLDSHLIIEGLRNVRDSILRKLVHFFHWHHFDNFTQLKISGPFHLTSCQQI